MAVSVAMWRGRVVERALAVVAGPRIAALRRLARELARRLAGLGPPPLAALALAPLALGPPGPSGPRDLLVGLLVLVALERAVPPLAAIGTLAWRELPRLPLAMAVSALAVAALLHPGLVVLALLAAACDIVRARGPSAAAAAAALALAAALRVDAGALLLGGPRGLLLPATIGALALVAALARARAAHETGRRPDPPAPTGGRLDLGLLAAFALALALALALAGERGVLGATPDGWAVLGVPLLAAALLATLRAAERSPDPGRVRGPERIAAAAGLGWLASLALACWLGAPP